MRHLIHGMIATLALAAAPLASAAIAIGISVNFAPPALPVYVQPAIPAPGYIWVPGYWAWDAGAADYYWVPGTWEQPPTVGLLWTPGYWGFVNGLYVWNAGYWGPRVGFYGGIDYGFGYRGAGYDGGYWRDNHFFYNRAVNNFGGVHVTNVYNQTVVNNVSVTRVSFNGGPGGVRARPTAEQTAIAHEHHVAATGVQREHEMLARNDQSLRARANGGHPAIAATARPTSFTGAGVVAARDARPVSAHGGRDPAANPPRPAPEPRQAAAPTHPPLASRPAASESRAGSSEEARRAGTPPHAQPASQAPETGRPGSAEPQRPATPPRPQAAPRPASTPESRGGTSEPQRPSASAPRPPEARSAPAPRPQPRPPAPPQAPREAPRPAPQAHQAPQHEPQARPQGRPEGHPQQPQREQHEGQGR